MPDSRPAAFPPLEAIRFDEKNINWLIEFLEDCPGRLSAAIVPGPLPGQALIERLRFALRNLSLVIAPHDASPAELADEALSLAQKDQVYLIRLDGTRRFASEEQAQAFWRSLNFQRERLAQGRLRTLFLLNEENDQRLIHFADDLREWLWLVRFPEAVLPRTSASEVTLERSITERGPEISRPPLSILRDQLRRAREAGLPESTLARHYAWPLFQALLDQGLVQEAGRVWDQDLRDGHALDFLHENMKLMWLGDLRLAQGDLGRAEKAYLDSLDIAKGLAEQDPTNIEWQRSLSFSSKQLGNLFLKQGDLSRAEKAYQDSLAVVEHFAKHDPTNTEWQRDLSVSYRMLGGILRVQGKLERAEKAYRDALAITKRLADQDPTNTEWQRDLSVSYDRLGDVLQAQGDLGRAEKALRDALAIGERLAAQDPANTGWQRDLSVSYNKLGDVLRDQGDLGRAEKAYQDALAIRVRLAAQDPANTLWQRDRSVSYDRLGDVLQAQGDLGRAEKTYRDALAITKRLAAQDPTNTGWQRDLSVSYHKLGDVLIDQGDRGRAEKAYRNALAIHERLAEQDRTNTLWRTDLAASSVKMTMVLDQNTAAGRDQARRLLQDSLAILRPLQAAGRLTPKQQGWIPDIEKRLARLDQPDAPSHK